jgi:MraZ protein
VEKRLDFMTHFAYTVYVSGSKWEKVERRHSSGVPTLIGELEHMFLGKYQHSLDSKGRLTIPSRFRELLVTDGAYLTQGFDHNLMVLPSPAFLRIYERVNKMSMTDANARLLKRHIFASAEQVDVDKAGRILIPEHLRQTVDLHSEAVVVGAGEYFEIWAPESWEEQLEKLNDSDANSQRFGLLDLST